MRECARKRERVCARERERERERERDLRHPRVFGTDHEAERLLVLRQVPFHRTLLLNHKRVSSFGFRVSGFGFRVSGFGFRV